MASDILTTSLGKESLEAQLDNEVTARGHRDRLPSDWLHDFAFAACVRTKTVEVGRLFHSLALHAAIPAAFGCRTTARWMCAFLILCRHKSSKFQKHLREHYVRGRDRSFFQIARMVLSVGKSAALTEACSRE